MKLSEGKYKKLMSVQEFVKKDNSLYDGAASEFQF